MSKNLICYIEVFRIKYGKVVIQLKEINSRVSPDSISKPIFYLLYIADLPVILGFIMQSMQTIQLYLSHYNSIKAFLYL